MTGVTVKLYYRYMYLLYSPSERVQYKTKQLTPSFNFMQIWSFYCWISEESISYILTLTFWLICDHIGLMIVFGELFKVEYIGLLLAGSPLTDGWLMSITGSQICFLSVAFWFHELLKVVQRKEQFWPGIVIGVLCSTERPAACFDEISPSARNNCWWLFIMPNIVHLELTLLWLQGSKSVKLLIYLARYS